MNHKNLGIINFSEGQTEWITIEGCNRKKSSNIQWQWVAILANNMEYNTLIKFTWK